MKTRRAYVKIEYNGTDVTKELNSDLLSFSFTDNASGNADDISIVLNDAKRIYIDKWSFEQGDYIKADIITINWRKDGDRQKLPCGVFMVDEPEYAGRPSIVNLKAISVPANTNFMNTKRTKVWKSVTLKAIGQEIAKRYGLTFYFDSKTNPVIGKKEQSDEEDASFLQTACEDEGFALKVTDKKLIMFNESEYEQRTPIAKFKESSSSITNYSFKPTLTQTGYVGVSLKYYDAKKKKLVQYVFSHKKIDENKDKIYKLNKQVANLEEAKRLAQNTLRKVNKKQTTATLELVGDTRLLSGCVIELEDFGVFSGKYYIDKAQHSLSGYKTNIEMHKVLEGY